MRRVYQTASAIFFALAVFVMWQGQSLDFYTILGPGPGFFPLWLGAILAVLSMVLFGQVSLKPVDAMAEGFIPSRSASVRLIAIVGALVVFAALLEPLGYRLSMLGLLLFFLLVVGRQNPFLAIAVSLAGSFGLFYGFQHWLEVQLPSSSIGFLGDLGL